MIVLETNNSTGKLVSRRDFLVQLFLASLLVSAPAFAQREEFPIPFLLRVRCWIRHIPSKLTQMANGQSGSLGEDIIRADYARGFVHLVEGYYISEAEIVNLG